MKKVSTVGELLHAVDELQKLGTIGVQIVPQQGVAILPRDDFIPSAKAKSTRFNNSDRVFDAKDGSCILGGKFSVFFDVGEIKRTDRAYLVPYKISQKFIELHQEVEVQLNSSASSTEVTIKLQWGTYPSCKETITVPCSSLESLSFTSEVEDEEDVFNSSRGNMYRRMKTRKKGSFDCSCGHFSYHNYGGPSYEVKFPPIGKWEDAVELKLRDRESALSWISL